MLKALLVDDEPLARKRLRSLLKPFIETNRIHIQAEARDGVEALELLAEEPVDLMFLDVQMPELTGFDVLERLSPEDTPVVIFTTAYDEYALKAFQAHAVDYLLKPVSNERLSDAISRAERLVARPQERLLNDERFGRLLDWIDAQDGDTKSAEEEADYIRQVSIPYRNKILVIKTEDLVAAEVRDGITRLVVLEHKPGLPGPKCNQYIVSYTLEQLESRLDPKDFMRVHRSSIVRLDHIKEMISWFSGRYKILLSGGHEVIASRERSKSLRNRLSL